MSYTREDLLRFLNAVDKEMIHPTRLIIIGGASLTLAYNFSNTTIDMDLLSMITAELNEAIEKAKSQTRLNITVSTANVYADLLHLEDRLHTPEDLNVLKKLQILIPEKHDLALMKMARSEPRDLDDINELHKSDPLNPTVLLQRFRTELLPLNSGDDRLIKDRFLDMIEVLFGEALADEYEGKL